MKGQVSLDVCSQRFASESLRVARHQVGIRDATKHNAVSTEALLYKDTNAAAQAMSELRAAVAACPTTPTKGPVAGSPAVSYTVNTSPDRTWPPAPGIDRFAIDLTATSESGQSAETTAVFLQRDRLLLAVYLRDPIATDALNGHPSFEALTDRFASEIAALPATQVQ